MDAIIWISVGVFLLLPYYMAFFMPESKTAIAHISFWCIINAAGCVIYYISHGEIISPASIILAVTMIYFIISYIFNEGTGEKELITSNVSKIVASKGFGVFLNVVVIGATLMLVMDMFIINNMESNLLDKAYLVLLLVLSYVQVLVYGRYYIVSYGEKIEVADMN